MVFEQLGDMNRFPMADGLSEKTLKSALKGTYVNLDYLLEPSTRVIDDQVDLLPVMDTGTGIISYKTKRQSRQIINFST